MANLNINSVSVKFEQLKHIIQDEVDILILTATKKVLASQTSNSILRDFVYHFGWIERNKGRVFLFAYKKIFQVRL